MSQRFSISPQQQLIAFEATLRAVVEYPEPPPAPLNLEGLTSLVVNRFARVISDEETLHRICEQCYLLKSPPYVAAEALHHLSHIHESKRFHSSCASGMIADATARLNTTVANATQQHELLAAQFANMSQSSPENCFGLTGGATVTMTLRGKNMSLPEIASYTYALKLFNNVDGAQGGAHFLLALPMPSTPQLLSFEVDPLRPAECSHIVTMQLIRVPLRKKNRQSMTVKGCGGGCRKAPQIRQSVRSDVEVFRQIQISLHNVCDNVLPINSVHRLGRSSGTHFSIVDVTLGDINEPLLTLRMELEMPLCGVPSHSTPVEYLDASMETVEEAHNTLNKFYIMGLVTPPWILDYQSLFDDVLKIVFPPPRTYSLSNSGVEEVLERYVKHYDVDPTYVRLVRTICYMEDSSGDAVRHLGELTRDLSEAMSLKDSSPHQALIARLQEGAESLCVQLLAGARHLNILSHVATMKHVVTGCSEEELQPHLLSALQEAFLEEVARVRAETLDRLDPAALECHTKAILLQTLLHTCVNEEAEYSYVSRMKSLVRNEQPGTPGAALAQSLSTAMITYVQGKVRSDVLWQLEGLVKDLSEVTDVLHDVFPLMCGIIRNMASYYVDNPIEKKMGTLYASVVENWVMDKLPKAILTCTDALLQGDGAFLPRSGTIFVQGLYGIYHHGTEIIALSPAPRSNDTTLCDVFHANLSQGLRNYMNTLRERFKGEGREAITENVMQHLFLVKKQGEDLLTTLGMANRQRHTILSQYTKAFMQFAQAEKSLCCSSEFSASDIVLQQLCIVLGTCKLRYGVVMPKVNPTRTPGMPYLNEKSELMGFLITRLTEVLNAYDLDKYSVIREIPEVYLRIVISAFERILLPTAETSHFTPSASDIAILHDLWNNGVVPVFEDHGKGIPAQVVTKLSRQLVYYFQYYFTPTQDLIAMYNTLSSANENGSAHAILVDYVLDLLIARHADPVAVEFVRPHAKERIAQRKFAEMNMT